MISRPYAINSPIGGFGNHLRWLLFLDSQFNVDLYVPSFQEQGAWTLAPTIEQLKNSPVHSLVMLEDKLKFINQFVYPPNRTWNNWLSFEWSFRSQLDNIILFNHFVNQVLPAPTKTIVTTIAPNIAYRHYLKLNSNLNNTPVELFKRVIDYDNHLAYNKSKQDNCLVVDLTVFDNEILDRSVYQQCVNFFGLSDQYNTAKNVHSAWYNLNKQAEKQFVKDIISVYGE